MHVVHGDPRKEEMLYPGVYLFSELLLSTILSARTVRAYGPDGPRGRRTD
jgi:hypothetical protein